MPIISVPDFTELADASRHSIYKWIDRGKIVTTEGNKKLIDTENPVNALFIQQRQDAHREKQLLGEVVKSAIVDRKPDKLPPVSVNETGKSTQKSTKTARKKDKVVIIPPQKPTLIHNTATKEKFHVEPRVTLEMKRAEAKRMNEQNMRAAIKLDQEAQLRQQNLDMNELKIQSEKIRLDKTAGNLLPIDLGLGVIERHANSILKTFEKGFERIADIYANFAGMDPTTRTTFIKECREELSHCVENAGKQAEAEIDILVDNYAETLMVGQKKA